MNTEAILHRNQVSFASNRALFVPVIARQIRARSLHIREVNNRFKRLKDQWNALHRIDEESSAGNRGWKEDLENKRDKRSQCEGSAVIFESSDAIDGSDDAQPDVDYGGGGVGNAASRAKPRR